jgi:enoyl-CoA hydratase
MSDDILVQQDGKILRVTLNRPDAGNAATDDMARTLTRVLGEAGKTSELVVLRGNGANFCLGRAGMTGGPPPTVPEAIERRRAFEVVFDCYAAFRRCEVPVVGAIHGRAAGFGCAIAALCDVTMAADDASFQVPEMAHNILPTMVMSALHDRVPRKAIGYLTWSTTVIDAERALTFGIVSEVVPTAGLDDAVAGFCDMILKTPPIAVRGVKEYLRSGLHTDPQASIDYARNLHAVINASSEIRKK